MSVIARENEVLVIHIKFLPDPRLNRIPYTCPISQPGDQPRQPENFYRRLAKGPEL